MTADIARDSGVVRGRMQVQVRVAAGERSIRLWLYADRMREPPTRMDERSWRWIYPGEVDRGGVEVSDVRLDGAPAETRLGRHARGQPRGVDVAGSDLFVALEPRTTERTIELSLTFELRVPGRFGRMGRDDGVLALAAPWYPLVVGADDAYDYRVPHRVSLSLDDGQLVAGDRFLQGGGTVEASVAYVPVVAAPELHQRIVRSAGVDLVLRTTGRLPEPLPPERRGDAGLTDLAAVDVAGLVAAEAEDVILSARAFGLPVPDRIAIHPIPSRTELAATAPSIVLLSDRAFQIFPLDQTLEFHRRAIRRALFRHLVAPLAAIDPPGDRGWATDLRAVAMVDLDFARRRTGAESPMELLQLLSFHPAVDQLLYAPQIAFEDAYFSAIEERDPFRDDPVRARRPLSRGRRILEMARDALEDDALRRWVAMLVNGRRPAREALARAAPTRAPRLQSWLSATGEPVNYRLGEVATEELADGRFRHTVTVHREGSTRVEPVEVRVEDDQGNREVAVWDGPGEQGQVELTMDGRVSGVTVDPRHRIPQSPEIADGHPRVDDATDHPWRPPVLNGFLLNVLVTEEDFTGLLDFALRRRYDLEHTIGLRLERTRAFTGGTLRYQQGVGDKVHTNRRLGRLAGSLSFDRLHQFFGDGDLGGWRAQASVSASVNTVRYSLDPRGGYWGAVAFTGAVAFRDDGSIGGTLRGGARVGTVLPLGLVNAFAIVVGGGFTAGDALLSELQGLGGPRRLRGFESGEYLGRGALYGVVEHRWTAFRDLAMNLAHLVWVREIQFAIFAGGGVAFDTIDGQDVVGAADVGVGVRIHYEYGGVQPGVITLDLGLPLTRTNDGVFVDGVLVRRRNPVGFYIGFDQFF